VVSAFRVFGEHGYRSTTMQAIARVCGLATGSLYTYFRGKHDLFRAAASEGWRLLLSELAPTLDSDRPLGERLDQLLDLAFRRLEETLPLLRGMLFEASRLREFHANLERFCEVVVTLIDQGRRQGLIRTETPGWKQLVRVMMNGVLFSAAVAPVSTTREELAQLKGSIRAFLRSRLTEGGTT
jgi:AcrR family transcriptional regulator